MVLQISNFPIIFTSVFHRILDFKNGVEFLFRPFFYFIPVMPDKHFVSIFHAFFFERYDQFLVIFFVTTSLPVFTVTKYIPVTK